MFLWTLSAPVWGAIFAIIAFLLFRLLIPESEMANNFGCCCIALPIWLISTTIVAYLKGTNEGVVTFIEDIIEDIKENPVEWIWSLFR